jgi:hypothetical protein
MAEPLITLPGSDPYSYSLRLEAGDLSFEYNADGLRELQWVAGRDNLAQGLSLTVATPLGSDIFNLLFGLDLYSILRGGYTLAMTKHLIRLHLTKTLTSDDRVLRIETLVFDDEPGFAEPDSDFDPEAARGLRKVTRRWQLRSIIQPIAGGPAVVPIEITGIGTS